MKMTVSQLANALQRAKRTIHRTSNDEKWPYTVGVGIGGSHKIYDITELPANTKQRMIDNILKQLGSNKTAVNVQSKTHTDTLGSIDYIANEDYWTTGNILAHSAEPLSAEQLTEPKTLKKALIALTWAYVSHTGQKKIKGFGSFVEQYTARLLPIQSCVYQVKPKVSVISLLRWDYANILSSDEKVRLFCSLKPPLKINNTPDDSPDTNQIRQQKLITLLNALGFDTQKYFTDNSANRYQQD